VNSGVRFATRFAVTPMKVHFGQVYVQPGVDFPFSFLFQHRLSEEVSSLVKPSAKFTQQYGTDWKLMFRISAKRSILDNEVRGPTAFRKDKDVEFTIFLPFDVIRTAESMTRSAIEFLLRGVCSGLDSLGFDTAPIRAQQSILAQTLSSDPTMLNPK
jgi:hypothetical protein